MKFRYMRRTMVISSSLIVMICLLNILFVSAIENKMIDPKIDEKFVKEQSVDLIVELMNESDVGAYNPDISIDEAKIVAKNRNSFLIKSSKSGFIKLKNDPRVKSIYYNIPVHGTLENSAPIISANAVWSLGYDGGDVSICVIDSGVDDSHSNLSGKIVDQYCYCNSPDSLLNSSYCCPDGSSEDINAEDFHGHGTNVVGIIASQNQINRGIASGADIYVVKVLNSSNGGNIFNVGQAITWCINKSVDVISISIGEGGQYTTSTCPSVYSSVDTAINQAYGAGIPVIVASGNEHYANGINYPACAPHAISVGATYNGNFSYLFFKYCTEYEAITDHIACFTNTGSNLDLLAPGCNITSTQMGGGFSGMCGTSQATPHVSGVAAILKQINASLSPDQILDILNKTGVRVSNWSRIDVLAAVNSLNASNSIYTKTFNVTNTIGGNLTITSITANQNWIASVSPTSFILDLNETQSVSVTVNSTGRSAGNYSGIISVYSNDPDENPKNVSIFMNIDDDSGENGDSCSSDNECQSNFCDYDGVGLSDDSWCFSPYNTYFDGQEQNYCEYSTNNGVADCDERQIGVDLDKCVGTSYYEDECSSTCNYQDITTVFECSETGCSCSQSLCDGLTSGSNIATCYAGQTYFADKCTATAGGEDRTDNVCRSNVFASGCTADSVCNGVTAGTGGCLANCVYSGNESASIIFDLLNIVSYNDSRYIFELSAYNSGSSDLKNFNWSFNSGLNTIYAQKLFNLSVGQKVKIYVDYNYSTLGNYNVTATIFNSSYNVSRSLNVSILGKDVFIESLRVLKNNSRNVTFEFVIKNSLSQLLSNVSWNYKLGNSVQINSTYPMNLSSQGRGYVYIDYIYPSDGNYIVIANVTYNGVIDSKNITINI